MTDMPAPCPVPATSGQNRVGLSSDQKGGILKQNCLLRATLAEIVLNVFSLTMTQVTIVLLLHTLH